MEDDLKISKVEYLSNHLWDLTKNLNLSLDDQIILYKFFWRQPKSGRSQQMLIGSYLNLNFSLYDQTIFRKWRQHPMEDDLKISKVEYPSYRL